jgi:Ti-type conjugative transfer relaxase TraA
VVCTRREEANQLRDAIDRKDMGAVLELMTHQRATFKERDVERVLSKQVKDKSERGTLVKELLTRPEIVGLSDQKNGPVTRYTTTSILDAERRVLSAADGLIRDKTHVVGSIIESKVLSGREFAGISSEQARAYRHATGPEGLAIIDGQAGTGKSYSMAAIRKAYEANGNKVIGLAPTNAVAQDMGRDGFTNASTIHSELFALKNGRARWNNHTVVMVDEAAMIDTKLMAQLTSFANEAKAKLILVGDDRQLSSIDRGGMFAVLKNRHGAAELSEVRRQSKNDDRRAAELMAEGNFHDALARYDTKGGIEWTRTQEKAQTALVRKWASDTAADPSKTRFIFAYTNDDVSKINFAIRDMRRARGDLGEDQMFKTARGEEPFAVGDRLQIIGTDKKLGLFNGFAGTITNINEKTIHLKLDGREGQGIEFDTGAFQDFRHGYAGTIYKGQGRTLDQTYLYHSEHWRSAASYVALTRHRDKAEMFVARNTAPDLKELARQMARVDNRKAASQYFPSEGGKSGEGASRETSPSPGGNLDARDTQEGAKGGRRTLAADLADARRSAEARAADPHVQREDDAAKASDGTGRKPGRDRGGGRSL